MKKLLALLLAVSLCLAACGEEIPLVTHTHDGLTISLPENFIDLSDEAFAEDFAFVYGLDPITVNGLKEEKSILAGYGLDLDLQQYGNLVLASNHVDCQITQKDGIWTFSYEASGYTYVVTLWETESAFWTVQAYCPTADFDNVQKDMWQILSSVTV